MNYSKKDLVKRLRAAYGYSARDGQRAVGDVIRAMLDLTETLQPGDALSLEHIGILACRVRPWKGQDKHQIAFSPSPLLRAHLRARTANARRKGCAS
ncbi:MAG: hypothetical protein Q8O14_14785 [bacterium]|nr:hypothetical protein [bacterium]